MARFITINSGESERLPEENYTGYYLMAAMVGALSFVALWIIFKAVEGGVKLFIQYWAWILGGILSILIFKKLFLKKRKKKKDESTD